MSTVVFENRRGFRSMSPEKLREVAAKGGRTAHQRGVAHKWTSEEAAAAGRKGGLSTGKGKGRRKKQAA